ncbi:hypothetical protein DWW76_12655 [Coprobacillus sp. AF17-11AC]|nr:hypothetical protein DWW80_11575 [Coprobacillus sp. AF17-17AC]RGG83485.1 hypothetical protein DWW76_12655 [Coprobacillus sp. AF17-11AC]
MPSAIVTCPFPFPDWELTDELEVYQTVDTEDQGPQETLVYSGLCKYDDIQKQVFNADSKLVSLSGNIVIKGEVITLPSSKFEGYVKINGLKREVYSLCKNKVMGFVFSTEIVLK